MAVMLKHMFVPMNVATMQLSRCKRVVLFNYKSESDTVEMRHFKICVHSTAHKRRNLKVPDLSQMDDIRYAVSLGVCELLIWDSEGILPN